MNIKIVLSSALKCLIGVAGLIYTFFTVAKLMFFLSDPKEKEPSWNVTRDKFWLFASWSLFIDSALLSLFMFSHSMLAHPKLKEKMASMQLHDMQRSLYICVTCFVLQFQMNYWQNISQVSLWNFNPMSKIIYWIIMLIHTIAWVVIYVGNICMDLNELLGIKQIYYSIKNLPDPNTYKSKELRRLYSHIRHPSFLGFLLILWIVPVMSLDRLFLASMMSAYMYLAWKPDLLDYRYQELQYQKKFNSFIH